MAKLNVGTTMGNKQMTSIMMRGSLAQSASKDQMSASASMLPPIQTRSNANVSAEDIQERNAYNSSPKMYGRTLGAGVKKPPISQSMVPMSSKASHRRKEIITPSMMRGIRKKEVTNSKYVNPQAVQLSPGLVMGSQVSQR
jgi:hypothetical protein